MHRKINMTTKMLLA